MPAIFAVDFYSVFIDLLQNTDKYQLGRKMENEKKKLWKKWWFWAAVIVFVGVLNSISKSSKDGQSVTPAPISIETPVKSKAVIKEKISEDFLKCYATYALAIELQKQVVNPTEDSKNYVMNAAAEITIQKNKLLAGNNTEEEIIILTEPIYNKLAEDFKSTKKLPFEECDEYRKSLR